MPRDLTKERAAHACMADACSQGRRACPVPQACTNPEGASDASWMWAHLFIATILVAFIGAWSLGFLA
jgi:hypothetical protein